MEKQPAGEFRFSPRPNRANEIQWREWGDYAFRQAQSEDKLILLAISAVWCHWCHIMDETTYSDQGIVDSLNRDYVPVRVDNDRRPDVNRRYNQGGWPTTAVLTPTGELLWGGTYVAAQQLGAVLRQAKSYYQANKAKIQAQISRGWQQEAAPPAVKAAVADLDGAVVAAVDDLRSDFDSVHGGFGTEPKFPHVPTLQFALERHYHRPAEGLSGIVTRTLDAMQGGAIFDSVAGGFFRYATQRDWSTPHFEKMLDDNTALLHLYLDAHRMFGDERYLETGRNISRYLLENLYDPANGTFYGSQDADEAYYALDEAGRRQREAPFVDRTVYVDGNAKAASAYAEGYRLLGDAEWRQLTLRAVDFLWARCYRPDLGMYHYWDQTPRQPGLLGDQVAMLGALLDAHEISGNPVYLDQAEELAVLLRREFAAPEGGFHDLAQHEVQRIGLLRVADRPLDENALAADCFRRVGLMSGNEEYEQVATETLTSFAAQAQSLGLYGARFAWAVDRQLRPPVHIVVVGDRRDARTADLFWSATRVFVPGKAAQLAEPHSNRLAALGYPAEPSPVAYLCINHACLPPITDPVEIERVVHKA